MAKDPTVDVNRQSSKCVYKSSNEQLMLNHFHTLKDSKYCINKVDRECSKVRGNSLDATAQDGSLWRTLESFI